MSSVQDCEDVTISIAVNPQNGGKSILFTCKPSGQVVGLACQKPGLTKAELAQMFIDFMETAPQAVKDKLNSVLVTAQNSLGAL